MEKILFVINGSFKQTLLGLVWDSVELARFKNIAKRYHLYIVGPNNPLGKGYLALTPWKVVSWIRIRFYDHILFSYPNRKMYWMLLFWKKEKVRIYFRGVPVNFLDNIVLKYLVNTGYKFIAYGDYLNKFNLKYDRVLPVLEKPQVNKDYCKENLIVFAGQLIEKKGIRLACQLFRSSRLYHEGYKFEVYGSGELYDELSQQYDEIYWMGKVDNMVVTTALNRAKFAILLTQYPEGFPRFLFEASLNGALPVLIDFLGNEYYTRENSILITPEISPSDFRNLILSNQFDAKYVADLAHNSLTFSYNTRFDDLY